MRTHLRCVSAIGQSQAVSMCACPIACSSCTTAAFGVASSSRRIAALGPGRAVVLAHTLQKRLSSRSSRPARWLEAAGVVGLERLQDGEVGARAPTPRRRGARCCTVEEDRRDRGAGSRPRRTRRCRRPRLQLQPLAAGRRRAAWRPAGGPGRRCSGPAPRGRRATGRLAVRRPQQVDALRRPRPRARSPHPEPEGRPGGPSCSPSSTGRYSSCRAASRPMRSVGPAMRMVSTERRSRCASPARRRAVCRRRSRV